jgi:ATP-binding cassette subfamily B protein
VSNQFDLDEKKEEQLRPFNRDYFLRMLGYLTPYRARVMMVALLMILVTAGQLAEPILMKLIIDTAIRERALAKINLYVLLFVGVRVVIWICARQQTRLSNWTGQQVLFDLRQGLFSHIQKLSFDFYDGRPVGKIMSRVTSDVNSMSQFVNAGVVTIVTQLLTLLGIAIILLSLHWQLALLCLAVMPLVAAFLSRAHPFFHRGWTAVREEHARVNAHLNESITGIQVIQAFSRQKINSGKFANILRDRMKAYLKVVRLEILFWPVIENLGALGTSLVIWYGAREYLAGALTIGTLWAFITYLNRFWQPLSAISRVYSQMLSAMASADRVFGFLDTKPRVEDAPDPLQMPEIAGRVEFSEVSFAYVVGQEVLRNVSFSIEPGQTVALVGPTGAGKSTIINLLARFYDPSTGQVRMDGYDLSEMSLQSFRSQLGIVLQDPFIFAGTIRENIEYGKLGASDDEIAEAARAVNAHDFIARLPEGYLTKTEERGGTLSQGQRQLLAFARALLAKPRLLILDEATSSIDTETERHIQDALQKLMQGRTTFVIAHRLSTIRNADVIMVIDDGTIVEKGSHSELMTMKGKYYELYTTQYKHMSDTLRAGN